MLFILPALLFAATPDTDKVSNGTEATEAKPIKVKKICRAGAATSTRLTNKICKTQAEWDAQIGADATKMDNQRGGSGY